MSCNSLPAAVKPSAARWSSSSEMHGRMLRLMRRVNIMDVTRNAINEI